MSATFSGTLAIKEPASSLIQNNLTAEPRPKRLRNPVRGQVRVFQVLATVFLAISAAVLPTGIAAVRQPEPSGAGIAWLIAGIVPGTLALIFGFVLSILLHYRKRYDRELAELERGAIVHWTYRDDEWLSYVARETANAKQLAIAIAGGMAAFGFLAGIIAACNGVTIAGSGPLAVAAMACGGGVMGMPLGSIVQTVILRRCRRLRNEVGEALIGENGLYFSGEYYPWSALGHRLLSVNLDEQRQPAVVEFMFRIQSSNGAIDNTVRVPVPDGQQVVAAALASALGY